MRFLADECCDADLVDVLRAKGHDVLYAAEEAPAGPDKLLLSRAFDSDRLLLTEDKDFGELVVRFAARGVVLLRFPEAVLDSKIRRTLEIIDAMEERLQGNFTVISLTKVRLRPLSLDD